MLESEIRELRDDIGRSVDLPPFDALVRRGRRRRGATIAGIATVGVIAVGAAAGASQVAQQSADTPPASHTNEPSGPGSADEILDAENARLFDYETDGSRAMSHWAVDCADDTCPSAYAWTDDGWASRQTRYLSNFVEVDLLEDGMLFYSLDEDPDYVLTDAGAEIDLLPPTAARPVGPDEIMIYRRTSSTWLALNPTTGTTHRILGPDGVHVEVVDKLPNGELHANGRRADGTMVYATSTDGGRSWTEHDDVPVGGGSPSILSVDDNVMMIQQGLKGVELTVSNDAGQTWRQIDDVPFGATGCMFPVDDGRLLVTNGTNLYTSTDATWSRFEQVKDAPSLECLSYSFTRAMEPGKVSGIAGDQSGAFTSSDNGRTWTAVDPR